MSFVFEVTRHATVGLAINRKSNGFSVDPAMSGSSYYYYRQKLLRYMIDCQSTIDKIYGSRNLLGMVMGDT